MIRFSEIKPDPKAQKILPFEMARQYMVFPLSLKKSVWPMPWLPGKF